MKQLKITTKVCINIKTMTLNWDVLKLKHSICFISSLKSENIHLSNIKLPDWQIKKSFCFTIYLASLDPGPDVSSLFFTEPFLYKWIDCVCIVFMVGSLLAILLQHSLEALISTRYHKTDGVNCDQ